MEVFVNPRVVGFGNPVDGIGYQHVFLRQHRDPVGDGVERVEVVGDQEHTQAQGIAQGQDQLVEGRRADGVEAGGGFVEKQDVRVQRQGAGEAGYLLAADSGRPARASLTAARCSASRRLRPACSISGRATFSVTVSEENSAPFWNSTPKRRSTWERPCSERLRRSWPNTRTLPSLGLRRPTMLRSSTDLPLPEPPTTARISPR